MPPTSPIPCPKPTGLLARWCADPTLFYERHPILGDYVYEATIDAWKQGRTTADGKVFLLRGRARSPTDEQLALWAQVEARLPELVEIGVAAVPEPPVPHPRGVFSRADLELAEVRIERDLAVYLFFSSPLEDEIELAPMVVFADWAVVAAEWVE